VKTNAPAATAQLAAMAGSPAMSMAMTSILECLVTTLVVAVALSTKIDPSPLAELTPASG
jgi:hypothetical protein